MFRGTYTSHSPLGATLSCLGAGEFWKLEGGWTAVYICTAARVPYAPGRWTERPTRNVLCCFTRGSLLKCNAMIRQTTSNLISRKLLVRTRNYLLPVTRYLYTYVRTGNR